jgi:hypothetical protein
MLDEQRQHRMLKKIHSGARRRALRSGIDFALAADHVEYTWQRQGGCCAVSGLSFNDERFEHALVKHPFAPNLDRIDSRRVIRPRTFGWCASARTSAWVSGAKRSCAGLPVACSRRSLRHPRRPRTRTGLGSSVPSSGRGKAGARVVRRGAENSATTNRSAQTLHPLARRVCERPLRAHSTRQAASL